jgi:hypothetical protein
MEKKLSLMRQIYIAKIAYTAKIYYFRHKIINKMHHMVKHIVLFKIKDDIQADDKQVIMTTFRDDILALRNIISCIKDINVGFNINPDEQWDICLDSTFETLDDVRYYSKHPQHVMAAGKLKPHLCGRSCVDFEI